jgi:FtsZ-binding cell division protein ZapB
VKVHWSDAGMAATLVAAGCVAIYAGLSRAFRRAVAERQQTMERRLDALTMTVKALQLQVAELAGREPALPGEIDAVTGAAENMADESQQVKPETLAVITAAATAFLGKKARIRVAHAEPASDAAGAWAQQGRVIVQTSHNLRPGA